MQVARCGAAPRQRVRMLGEIEPGFREAEQPALVRERAGALRELNRLGCVAAIIVFLRHGGMYRQHIPPLHAINALVAMIVPGTDIQRKYQARFVNRWRRVPSLREPQYLNAPCAKT